MQCVDGSARKGIVLGEQVHEDFVVVEAAVGQDRDDARNVLGNNALLVEEGSRNVAGAFAVAPRDELACVEQVEDAGDLKIKLVRHFLQCQQLLISQQGCDLLRLVSRRIVLRVVCLYVVCPCTVCICITHRHNLSWIPHLRPYQPYWNA